MSDDHRGNNGAGKAARVRPVERFLGPAEGFAGPFALLGVSPRDCTEHAVLSALERQLERVNSHPQCDTPEADEVRLALHAAAAQLLDPVVRRHLVSRWTGVADAMPGVGEAGGAGGGAVPVPRPAAVPGVDSLRMLEHDAILTLGLLGWNQRSLRRLASLAHARGFTNEQVAVALRNLSRGRARPREAGRAPTTAPTMPADSVVSRLDPPAPVRVMPEPPVAEEGRHAAPPVDPSQRLLRNAVMAGAGAVLALVMLAGLIIVATHPAPPAPAPPAAPAATAAAPSPAAERAPEAVVTEVPTPRPRREAPPPDPADAAGIGRELAASAQAAQLDPDAAVERFAGAVARLAAGWGTVPRDRLIAAHDSILEFVYRAGGSTETVLRAIEAVAQGARDVRAKGPVSADRVMPAVWSAGMLARLSRERDIPATGRAAIEAHLAGALGNSRSGMDVSFEAGAAAMMYALPARMIPARGADLDAEAWRAWAEAAEPAAGPDAAARSRMLLAGLESLLVLGPEPNQSRGAGAAINDLVARLTWREEDESRRWLLRWFGDQRVSMADLQAVTSALATRSSAEGVDLTMVLSTSASERVRSELRDRYATVWGVMAEVERDELTAQWAEAARGAVEASLSGGGDMDQLESAVLLARLNEAAWWHWRGDGAEAAGIVADLRGPIELARSGGGEAKGSLPVEVTDGGWAEKYLAAKQNLATRKEMLEQVRKAGGELGPVDAEVIVADAVSGTPQEIRSHAQEVVRQLAAQPAIINAMLERLPKMPRVPASSALVEAVCLRQLPPVRSGAWPMAARRALVERLLEGVASESPMAVADRFAGLLAVSYRSMASAAPLSTAQRHEPAQPSASDSAALLWAMWRDAAEKLVAVGPAPVRLDAVERRLVGRRGQARGMVQAFAAEQSSLCELMGYVVGVERPGRSEDVAAILAQFSEDRRRAVGILEQLNAAERAMTQLWLIRLSAPQEGPPA